MKRFLIRLTGGVLLVFITCLVTFFLFKALPGDAYADQLYRSYASGGTKTSAEVRWQRYVKNNALDKPLFYFSLLPSYVDERATDFPLPSQLTEYSKSARNYKPRSLFYEFWAEMEKLSHNDESYLRLKSGLVEGTPIDKIKEDFPEISASQTKMNSVLSKIKNRKTSLSIPLLHWHGSDNQFHFWLSRLFTGELRSEKLNQSVYISIWNALLWTLSINIPAFVFLLLFGGILGSAKSLKNNSVVSTLESIFYVFYSMPLFWLCALALTMAISLLPEGSFQLLIGPFISEDISLYTIYRDHFSSIYIPIICIIIHSTIYISRHVEQSIDSVKNSRFVLAAESRGLSKTLILRKHIIPNSIRPIITLIPQLLPGMIAGSVIVELIFNIPGMGRLFWDSLLSRDWQMVLSLVIFSSIVVYICMWIADILYPEDEKIDAYA